MPLVRRLRLLSGNVGEFTRDAWVHISGRRAPRSAEPVYKARIWVVGPAGVGKTTLINTCLDENPRSDQVVPQTLKFEWRFRAQWPIAFADTRGLEMITGPEQVRQAGRLLAKTPPEARPH